MEQLFTNNTSDIEQAYRIVGNHYGDLAAHHIEMFRDGFDHTVIVVDGTMAFRFAKNQEYLNKLPVVSRFLKEFAPLSPVAVPVSEVLNDEDTTYEQYEFLPGQPLKPELAATFSTENLADIAAGIGAFLTALHSFPATRAAELGIPTKNPYGEWQERYDSIRRHVFPTMGQDENAWISKLFDPFLASLSKGDFDLRVIHFDIKPDHIIVNPDSENLVGLIDFGDMKIGDPAYDFTFFARYSPDLTPHVLEAYDQEKDESFLRRVSFYQNVLPLMDLDHALEIGAHEKADALQDHLSRHIAASHLLQ